MCGHECAIGIVKKLAKSMGEEVEVRVIGVFCAISYGCLGMRPVVCVFLYGVLV